MSSTSRGSKRNSADAYITPPELARFLVGLLLQDGWVRREPYVLEPSAGTGSFVKAASELLNPKHLCAVDIHFDTEQLTQLGAHALYQQDFLTFDHDDWDLIPGNPPFSQAEAHVRHALSLLAPGGTLAFLLRLAFLESQKRIPFWKEHPAAHVYVLSERPSFTGGATDSTAYGMFVWRRARAILPTTLQVVSWVSEQAAATKAEAAA